jgi:hypothetical protein
VFEALAGKRLEVKIVEAACGDDLATIRVTSDTKSPIVFIREPIFCRGQ